MIGGRLRPAGSRESARHVVLIAAAFLATSSFRAPDDTRVPVVVELFTSEGCSDCPPADRVLRDLARQQPVAGARIVILSEHVDYFNHDGWVDPFSSRTFTNRQSAYDEAARSSGPYTPEMIVDGSIHFVGADRTSALAAIRRAAARPKPEVRLTWQSREPLVWNIKVDAGMSAANAHLFLAVTEDGLTSNVRDGENKGRQLVHDGVVRRLTSIGSLDKTGSFSGVQTIKAESSWKGNLRAVLLVQKDAGAVIGVDSAPIR